ncbi:MAG: VWA domain-containing protein [Deltaproteobacteria bacterium]|nr:VWA domain-containing protein [Deltaproteobacteria bacterium]
MVRPRTPRADALALLAAISLGCSGGSRPPALGGFDLDAGADESLVSVVRDAIPLREMPSCGGTAMSLTRRRASAILVIDRSGSMVENTLDGVRKWTALLAALDRALPRIERNVSLGLVTFPQELAPGAPRTAASVCALRSTLDLEPRFGAASAIMARLRASLPNGPTPTAGAEEVAGRWFVNEPDREGGRYLILATDGAPNCNTALEPTSCRCSGGAAMCDPMMNSFAPINCLDDERATSTIRLFRQQEIFTYVLGLNGAEAYASVLDSMAVEGGRARAGSPRFYPANTADELVRELTAITSGIADCRFALDAAPPDPTLVDLRLDGESLIHDEGQRDGWDWSDASRREIRFYGATCDRVSAATGGSRLVAAFGCPAPAPP